MSPLCPTLAFAAMTVSGGSYHSASGVPLTSQQEALWCETWSAGFSASVPLLHMVSQSKYEKQTTRPSKCACFPCSRAQHIVLGGETNPAWAKALKIQ